MNMTNIIHSLHTYLDPDRKLRILVVVTGNYTVSVGILESYQLVPALFPDNIVRVPYEPNLIQQLHTFIRKS